jgi:hypothetical protein
MFAVRITTKTVATSPITTRTAAATTTATTSALQNNTDDATPPTHHRLSIISPAAASCLVYGKDDMLFGCIEEQQGTIPFGNVLDAGTGMHSLRWIARK